MRFCDLLQLELYEFTTISEIHAKRNADAVLDTSYASKVSSATRSHLILGSRHFAACVRLTLRYDV